MQVQVHINDQIQGGESLAQWLQQEVQTKLERFRQQVPRVDAYLTDQHSGKPTDKRCVLEAKLRGREPIAAHAEAATVAEAVSSAMGKLQRALDSEQGRQREHGRDSIRANVA